MPKETKYPRLRTKVYRGRSGQVWSYWTYDMRPEGKPDIRLGRDYEEAIRQWEQLHHHRPRVAGRLQEAFDKWRDIGLKEYANKSTRVQYAKHLARIEPVFGQMAWDEITVPILHSYLVRRSGKSQGNRELSLLSIIWAKGIIWGLTRQPWPATGVKGWKNKEPPRRITVSDAMFDSVYAQADRVLRDCMDIATSTGMRLTDVRTVAMPSNGMLTFRANKTDKAAQFDVSASPVLSALVARREAMKAHSIMLLVTDTGRQLSERMLGNRWDVARDKAATKASETGNEALAKAIRAMYLRDMRKRAANLADDTAAATELLQHSSQKLTEDHYRTKAAKLRAVR